MQNKKCIFNVIIPKNIKRRPEDHEQSAAQILANHYKSTVRFINTGILHSADIEIKKTIWEIKSPLGNGKRTIQHQVARASKQSKNIVIDLRRTKLNQEKAIRELRRRFNESKTAKKLIVITGNSDVIEL